MRTANFLLSLFLALASAPFWSGDGPGTPTDPGIQPATGQAVRLTDAPLAPAFSGCGGVLVPVVNAEYEQTVIDLVNQVRGDNGLPPYKRVDLLDQASRYHAADMAQDGYFQHDSYDIVNGQLQEVCSWSERITSFYVPPGSPSWNYLSENIAAGYSSPAAVMDGWMNSSGHRANILSSGNWEIGVGYYQGGSYGRYWVQDFGRRSGVYPLVINREAASTDSREVSLYIYGEGVFNEMRLRNDDDDWGAWQAYQPNLSWELSCSVGEHTVSVELRSATRSASSSDTIQLAQSDCEPALGNLPERLNFSYSIADQALQPAQVQLQPLNVGGDQTLTWSLDTQGDWFSVQPQGGSTPQQFAVTLGNFDAHNPGTYEGEITVTVTDPSGVAESPQTIDLSLRVFPDPFRHAFLPHVTR